MKFYAFARQGRTFVMTGATIREAAIKLEEKMRVRLIMGCEVRGTDLRRCDPYYLTAAEQAAYDQEIAGAEAVAA